MTDSPSTQQATETGKSDAAKTAAELEKEFEGKVAKPGPQDDPVRQYVQNKMQEEATTARDKGIADTVAALKEHDSLKGLPDTFVRGAAYDYAARNPAFNDAFQNRQKDPQGFKAAMEKMRDELVKDLGGDKSTDNLRAAHLATRGTSLEVPKTLKKSETEVNNMSDHEFNKWKRALPAFVPATALK